MSERLTRLLPLVAATAIAIGGVAHVAGAPRAGDAIWAVALAVVLVPLTVSVARSLCAGDLGVVPSRCWRWRAPWPWASCWPAPWSR